MCGINGKILSTITFQVGIDIYYCMNKQERYIQWVIDDIKKNTYLLTHPTRVRFGGVWSVWPKHFFDLPHPQADIWGTITEKLLHYYGLTEDELGIIVEEIYPWIVDTFLEDYPRL